MKIPSVARQINRVIKAGVNSPALKAFKKAMQLFKLDTGKNLLTRMLKALIYQYDGNLLENYKRFYTSEVKV